MTPVLLALVPEAVSLVRWLMERYGGNKDATRAALRRIRDEWAEWEATKGTQRDELERVLARRAAFSDLARRAADSAASALPDEQTPAETPIAKKGASP